MLFCFFFKDPPPALGLTQFLYFGGLYNHKNKWTYAMYTQTQDDHLRITSRIILGGYQTHHTLLPYPLRYKCSQISQYYIGSYLNIVAKWFSKLNNVLKYTLPTQAYNINMVFLSSKCKKVYGFQR